MTTLTEGEERRARATREMSADVLAVVEAAESLLTRIDRSLSAHDRWNTSGTTWAWPLLMSLRSTLLALLDPVTGPRTVAANEVEAATALLIESGLEDPPQFDAPAEAEPVTEAAHRRRPWRRTR